jgi:hypothetical protein
MSGPGSPESSIKSAFFLLLPQVPIGNVPRRRGRRQGSPASWPSALRIPANSEIKSSIELILSRSLVGFAILVPKPNSTSPTHVGNWTKVAPEAARMSAVAKMERSVVEAIPAKEFGPTNRNDSSPTSDVGS